MNLTKCSKGHYYDGDKYSACPFCNGAGAASGGDSMTVAAGPSDMGVTVAASSGSAGVTMAMPGGGGFSSDPVTVKSSASSEPVTQKSPHSQAAGNYSSVISDFSDITGSSALPDDDAPTQSFYQPMMDNFQNSPAGVPVMTAPVVGWLVCISGSYFGRSFPLKAGRNFVGRSPQADVCLEGEKTVSRDRHAVIIYEPKGRMFIAQPGDSRELFYLNDKVVLDNEKLSPYDIIAVGKVELMLMPFCTDKFAWEDLEKKKEAKKNKDEKKKNAGINLNKEAEESK